MNIVSHPGHLVAHHDELGQIAEEIERLRLRLVELNRLTEPAPRSPLALVGKPDEHHAKTVRKYLRSRRMREGLFPADLFADPAWDILLDLYASGIEGKAVSVSSACIASAVPPTTALRWVVRLEELHLIYRVNDKHDARRHLLRLTSAGLTAIEEWVKASL